MYSCSGEMVGGGGQFSWGLTHRILYGEDQTVEGSMDKQLLECSRQGRPARILDDLPQHLFIAEMPLELTRVEERGAFPAISWEKGEYHWDYDITLFTNKLCNNIIKVPVRMSIMMSATKTVYKSHYWPLSLSSNEYSVRAVMLSCLYFSLSYNAAGMFSLDLFSLGKGFINILYYWVIVMLSFEIIIRNLFSFLSCIIVNIILPWQEILLSLF